MVLQTIRWLGLMLFRLCGNSDAKLYAWCQAGNKWDYCKVTTFPYPSRTVDSKVADQAIPVDTTVMNMPGATLMPATIWYTVVQQTVTPTGLTTTGARPVQTSSGNSATEI